MSWVRRLLGSPENRLADNTTPFTAPATPTMPALTALSAKQQKGRAARASGYAAESAIADWLGGQGAVIVARNFGTKGGELDVVLLDGDFLVFVEIRQRHNAEFGGAAESITRRKQQRIIHAAQVFLAANPTMADRPCRFDCVLLDGNAPHVWLHDAFRID